MHSLFGTSGDADSFTVSEYGLMKMTKTVNIAGN